MRDRDRIPGVIADLMTVWEQMPDLRLGQFLMGITNTEADLFYIEDEELVDRIKAVKTANYMQGRLL